MKIKDLNIISIARGAVCTECGSSTNLKEIHIGGSIIALCEECRNTLSSMLCEENELSKFTKSLK